MKDTVRNMIANIAQTMAGDPEFEFLSGFWHFPGQVNTAIQFKCSTVGTIITNKFYTQFMFFRLGC